MYKKDNIVRAVVICSSMILGVGAIASMKSGSAAKSIQSSNRIDGLNFEMQGCQRQHKSVVCTGQITNTVKNSLLTLFRSDVSLTAGSVQYFADKMHIGSKHGDIVHVNLAKGVPTQSVIVFNNIPIERQSISLMTIYPSTSTGSLKFENIKITEQEISQK